jgi:phosphoribosyl-ATP pyrophosphohydrolase/phosphoribosyl-AMP cyclohydrolase
MNVNIDWEKVSNLLPVIVQDAKSLEVLMLAYMNNEAYELTCKSGYAHYFSRTKGRIWKKGETSGHVQKIEALFLDCDNDTLLLHVEQVGGIACHTGRKSCFFNQINPHNNSMEITSEPIKDEVALYGIVDTLYHLIQERKNADPSSSYVAKLLHGKENSMLKKIAEEAAELCFAMKDKDEEEIVYEATDLLFHVLVGLGLHNIHPDRIKQELARRFGLSGIAEKNAREHGNT